MQTWIWVTTPSTRQTSTSKNPIKGGFSLLRYFYVCMHLDCARLSKIGAMYELSRVNVNLKEVPLSTFTRNLSYIASM